MDNAIIKWNHIKTENEIKKLHNSFSFHDSIIKEIRYISGSYVDENMSMQCLNTLNRLYVLMQSQWENHAVIELCFEELKELDLKPVLQDDNMSVLFGATLFINKQKDIEFLTCDDYAPEDEEFKKMYEFKNVSYIKAKKCKWRTLDKAIGPNQVYIDTATATPVDNPDIEKSDRFSRSAPQIIE